MFRLKGVARIFDWKGVLSTMLCTRFILIIIFFSAIGLGEGVPGPPGPLPLGYAHV